MIIINAKILPRSRENKIVSYENEVLKIKIMAAPEKNKANDALIEFLAKSFKISPYYITILSGHGSRIKKLRIDSFDKETFLEKLNQILPKNS